MPSRFEPCGLAQLYAMRYGALPVVRRVGGLADTVVDADPAALAGGRATGFVFDDARADALAAAVGRLVTLYGDPPRWARLQQTAMTQDYSWRGPAGRYLALYEELVSAR
jgi:starch synthase